MNGDLSDRIFAVLVGARVGDAMGEPTEGKDAEEIERRYQWVAEFDGTGTDDSLMASLLIEALVSSDGRASQDEWAAQIAAGHELIQAQRQKFFISVLHLVAKLRYRVPPRAAALPGDRGQRARRGCAPGLGSAALLLAEPGSRGLQVRAGRDGDWVDVPARDGAFIVNIGELLELATGGYLRATEHRVNLRHAADRISVPYFSTRDWTRRSQRCRYPRNSRSAPGVARTRQIRSSRCMAAMPGRAGCGHIRTLQRRTAT